MLDKTYRIVGDTVEILRNSEENSNSNFIEMKSLVSGMPDGKLAFVSRIPQNAYFNGNHAESIEKILARDGVNRATLDTGTREVLKHLKDVAVEIYTEDPEARAYLIEGLKSLGYKDFNDERESAKIIKFPKEKDKSESFSRTVRKVAERGVAALLLYVSG